LQEGRPGIGGERLEEQTMKKTIWKQALSVLLALAMLAALTACGASGAQSASAPAEEAPAEASAQEAASAGEAAPEGETSLKDQYASLAGKTLKVATSGV